MKGKDRGTRTSPCLLLALSRPGFRIRIGARITCLPFADSFVRYKINRDFESKDRFSPAAPVVEDEFFMNLCWGYRRKITMLNL